MPLKFHTLVYTQEKRARKSMQKSVHKCLWQHDSQQSKSGPSTDEWLIKMWFVHRAEYHLAIKRNEVAIHTATGMHFESIMVCPKDPELYGPTVMKFPEQANLKRNLADQGLPGAEVGSDN